jgi:hypothetical protein
VDLSCPFSAAYPSEAPIITGFHPLHVCTKAVFARELCYLWTCLIKDHVPGEVSLYDALSEYHLLRGFRAQLSTDEAERLSRSEQPYCFRSKRTACYSRRSCAARCVSSLDPCARISDCLLILPISHLHYHRNPPAALWALILCGLPSAWYKANSHDAQCVPLLWEVDNGIHPTYNCAWRN